ncbi:hypothetical protein ON010_g9524 [Phytophthora cinnamomi]|nr:hypothetical protein ON010_g9524 [Phytophthora cinnamomi]
MRRAPGNEYINTYVLIVNALFKCNNDIKVLGAGEGPEKSYYTIKYSTKPQNDIDKSWVIHLHAFAKASRSTIEDSSDIAAIGRRRIQSMCCTLSNPHDISTPMACLYIDRGPAMYSSHEFVKLPITSVFCALFEQEKNIPVVLESDTNMRQFKPSGIRLDYTYRPEGLEDVDLMTFATQWIKKNMFKLSEQRIATVLHNASPRYPPTGSAGSGSASLPANHHNFNEFFEQWWTNDAPLTARTFMQNNLDYYVSRELLKTQEDPEVARYCSYTSAHGDDDGNVDLHGHVISYDDNDDGEGDFLDEEQQNFTNEVVWAPFSQQSILMRSTNLRLVQSLLHLLIPIMMLNIYSRLNDYPDVPTRVQLLQRALEGPDEQPTSDQINPRSEHQPEPVTIPEMPSLHQVSLSLGLNEKQNLIVINAVQILAEKWRSKDSVVTAAYQGVAAQAANGQTIHKLFGWNVNSRRRWTLTNEQKERFAKLRLLIINEISTCDVSIIGKNDASLRILLGSPSKRFGGIHVLLVGDWLQQLPVAGQPAFLAASEILHEQKGRETASSDFLDRVRGINAYRSLNYVVILTENMRHRNDQVWRAILDKWRVGQYDDADIEHVNKIAYYENWTTVEQIKLAIF